MSDPAGAKPMIEVCGLEVRYGDVPAVNGVSFGVGRGELLTLLGPSGCGKTTTLRAIAGLEQPCGGSIALDGTIVYSGRIGSLRRFKDDVGEVKSGFECGIGFDKFNDLKVGDMIEVFAMERVLTPA